MMKRWHQSLDKDRQKAAALILAFIVLAIGMIEAGYYSFKNFEQRHLAQVESQLSAIADMKVNVLSQWRMERLGDGDLFFNNHAFASLLQRFLAHPEEPVAQQQLQDWLSKIQMRNQYNQVHLLNARGATLMAIPAERSAMSGFILKQIPAILQAGQVHFEDFYVNEHNQSVYLSVLVPIYDPVDTARPLGVLALCIDPNSFLAPFLRQWPMPSTTAETVLLRRDGGNAVILSELRFRSNTTARYSVPLTQTNLSVVQAALGMTGIREGLNYRGARVVAALHAVPDSPWFLIARMDVAEVYAALWTRFWQTAGQIGALLLCAAAFAGLLWRRQRIRYYIERYRMAEALRASELRYRRLFETAKVGILVLDAETGLVLDVNPFLSELLGFPRDALRGKKIQDLGCFRALVAPPAKLAELQARDDLRLDELPLGTATGRHIEVEMTSHAYAVNERRVIHCSFRDITAAKQAALEKAQREAQTRQLQKAESLSRMAGALAHHFNNKLQVVIGNLDLAQLRPLRDGQLGANLEDAMHAAREAARLSGLLLTYLGQAPHETKPLDLAELCRQSLPMLRIAMPIVLEDQLDVPGLVVEANANLIQQVLSNLVTNAQEAGGVNRGSVRLAVSAVAAQKIPLAHRFPVDWSPQTPTYACISVMDSGCGIARGDIEKLFDPFFTRKFAGRGLGLSVVLGIVRMHSGCITVESEPGQGSTFQVYLPMLPPSALPAPEPAEPFRQFTAGGTVLLVDDEAGVRKLAATMLAYLGFQVLTAEDGIEAEAVFQQHQADIRCVVTDLTMPRRDGWATIAALRALRADLPVILASGYDVTAEMTGQHPARPQAFLSKPYTQQQLRAALGRALAAA